MTDWRYPTVLDAEFFSQNTSGAQQLPNGNILITEGASGDIREIDENQDVVWNYRNPIGVFGAATQGCPSPEKRGVPGRAILRRPTLDSPDEN